MHSRDAEPVPASDRGLSGPPLLNVPGIAVGLEKERANPLGSYLRARRDLVTPAQAGIIPNGRRRLPGSDVKNSPCSPESAPTTTSAWNAGATATPHDKCSVPSPGRSTSTTTRLLISMSSLPNHHLATEIWQLVLTFRPARERSCTAFRTRRSSKTGTSPSWNPTSTLSR